MKKYIVFILIMGSIITGYSQSRVDSIKTNLETLAETYPALKEKVSISVSDVSIQEFIRGVAKSSKVNINVSPDLQFMVVNNFSDVQVVDMLVFLAKQYDLDIDITGNIISISKHIIPEKVPEPPKPKELKIFYQTKDSLLSLDLRSDSLYKVAKVITEKTGQNIILAPGVENKRINSFVKNKPFDQTIEMLAYANNLKFSKNKDGFYILEAKIQDPKTKSAGSKTGKSGRKTSRDGNKKNNSEVEPEMEISVAGADDISIYAVNTPIYGILKTISDQLGLSYYFLAEIKDNANLNVSHITYDQLIDHLFDGTEYTAFQQKGVYLFGEKKTNELLKTKVLQLQYRTVDKLSEVIPENLKQDLTINEFLDLNSLIITGPESQIADLEMFVREVDKVVPVVLIEVLIIDVSRSYTQSIGIDAGLNSENVPARTTGQFSSGLNMNFSTSTINNLINSFNGFGWFNIGKVTPDFYLSIRALEENGIIKLRSTPMLSTLNGSEASLKIGEKQYYYEETQNTIGSQNPQNIKTGTWKPVNADLDIKIKPVVSGDEQVTLEVEVSQSDFTGKVATDAPPGSVDRSFKSYIRIKNQEMVLLGGLENKKKSDAGGGLPFLSRIPILKWIFGSRTRTDSFSKLTIFIKPTVIY